jgi:hypothetical protein
VRVTNSIVEGSDPFTISTYFGGRIIGCFA